MVPLSLLLWAEREFPFLMDHETSRDDAVQILAMVLWETQGRETIEAARIELSNFAQALGYRRQKTGWQRVA